ncbi:hypothetical protein TrST_g5821 [Triparma strigata]|uniref:Aldehyde dehydrogenase domain-containing protein n=1 Tax=Triparma strigata TaxID=1606541 RepID=A0A9W7AI85_9STRA|nr:hypothetical protein TrST_g5821 [Triparma strigata]
MIGNTLKRLHPRLSQSRSFQTHYGSWINGASYSPSSAPTYSVVDPARLNHLCTIVDADEATVDMAVKSGRDAFEKGDWRLMDVRDRAEILNESARRLRERVPEFAETESLQTGRAIREMNAQLGRLPEWLEYFAALIRTHEGTCPPFKGPYVNYVKRVPLGVCAQITPWNHPMLIAIKKIAPALATGNSIVVKPSEFAPITVLEFAKLMTECGLPDGVFNVVPGQGACGAALSGHSDLDMVDLTGGTPTGRKVHEAAGKNLATVLSELGGKAPMIVFNDADIEQAVNGTAFGSFIATGQTCIAGTRLLVQEDIYDDFVAAYVEKVSKIRIGDPKDPSTQMGPVINQGQLEKVREFCELGEQEGGKILTGGKPVENLPDELKNGYYWPPTVIGDCHGDMRVVREEVFGPVVVAYKFKDEADAIAKANDSEFGLAASIWSQNIKRAHRVADKLDVGIVWLNDHHRNDPSSPWGGMKDSGVGRENGIEALHEYTQTRSVVVGFDDTPFDWFVDHDARYG